MPLTDEIRDEINNAIFAGRKVEAVKRYRDATGQGLLESKEFIEQLTKSLRKQHPDLVPAEASGCGSAVVLLAVVFSAAVYCLLA